MNNEAAFSETEDTKLKQFLTGSRIYTMLALAIISALVFVVTVAGMIGVYSNCKQAQNIEDFNGLDVSRNLNGQYVVGSAYKFLAKLGYIAQSDSAATHYYYLMYTDAADGNQYVTLVEAPKDADPQIQTVITDFLNYVQNYSDGSVYQGSALQDMTGRFKNMSSEEKEIMEQGVSSLGLGRELMIDYTLKVGKLPKTSDTIGYWFIAIPFGIAMIVGAVLFIYGVKLEDKRAEANKSPYPYLNRKKK